KLSADTVAFANFTLAPHRENARVRSMVSSTNQTIAPLNAQGEPTGNGGIMPGFTDQVTVVRPVAGSRVTLNGTHNQRKAQAFAVRTGARTKKDPWDLDYDLSYSYAANNPFVHTSSIFLTGAGWTVSKGGVRDWKPNLTFTAGPDPYSISSYLSNQLTLNSQRTLNEILGTQINFQKRFNMEVPASIKTGLKFRQEGLERYNRSRQWNFVGSDGTMGTPDDRLDPFVDAN